MVRRTAFAAVLVGVFFAPLFAYAQETRTTPTVTVPSTKMFGIRGSVRLAQNERPLEMVKVELKRFSGEMLAATYSRSDGEFEFLDLPSGDFYLVVEERGYSPVRQSVQIRGSSVHSAIVYLTKIDSPFSSEKKSDSISVHELKLSSEEQSAFRKGMEMLYKKHDPMESIPLFQKVVNASPNFFEGHFHLGVAYDMLRKTVEAEAAFRKAIAASNEKYPKAFIALASLLTTQGRAAEAEPLVRQGLTLDSSSWQGHFELGRVLAALNKLEEAEKCLQETVQMQKSYPPAYLVLASVHIRMKNQSAVLRDLAEYLRLEPIGPQSEQARRMLDNIQRAMQNSQNGQAIPPKP